MACLARPLARITGACGMAVVFIIQRCFHLTVTASAYLGIACFAHVCQGNVPTSINSRSPMDHQHGGSMPAAAGHNHGMVPYLHFSGGDSLLLKGLAPKSTGAIAGACITLFCLAVFDRWISAMRTVLDSKWKRRALAVVSGLHPKESSSSGSVDKNPHNFVEETKASDDSTPQQPAIARHRRTFPPFIFAFDASRGALFAFQSLLGYILMLSVMTFQAAYLICIVVGLGIGEILFGRLHFVRVP